MNKNNRVKIIFLSWDTIIAIIASIIYGLLANKTVSAIIVKEISLIAISTLSIIFSVFFAALAVLITAGDNDFVIFLQKSDTYANIIWFYKYTLLVIFVSLVFSIILYFISLFETQKNLPGVFPCLVMIFYVFLTSYSLLCTLGAAINAIKYAEYRTRYLHALEKTKDKQ